MNNFGNREFTESLAHSLHPGRGTALGVEDCYLGVKNR